MVTIHVRLAHDLEAHTIVDLAEGLDVVVCAGFLTTELVAREAENDEVVAMLGLQFLVEAFQTFVLRGEATLGGRVDNEDYFAFVSIEGDCLSFLWRGR
jgi:hypothetical protein